MSKNIKTTLHHYRFDLSDAEQAANYETLKRETLKKIGFPVWRSDLSHGYTANPKGWKFADKVKSVAGEIELETKHLFSNQWNSAPCGDDVTGLRLFNWCEYKYANKSIKAGYWLEQTAEMRDVLRNTHKCGYCGKQCGQKGYTFCPHCLDSEYLKVSDLHLTRMVPVCDTDKNRAELTTAERAHLLPLYREAQLHGATERGKARIAAARRKIETEYTRTVANAKEKRDAAIWVMDNMPGMLGNWIFYDHANKHCFGWRSPVDSEVLSELLDVISEFPFSYEIKCSDGRTLEGY